MCRAYYDADTTERFFRNLLEEAKRRNESKEVIDNMNGDLERVSAITKEAKAMVDEAEERYRIVLKAIGEHNNPLNIPFSQPHEKAKTN